jgi:hypothetical protein
LPGSSRIALYFAVPVYASYLDKIAPFRVCLPAMFFFGYSWPALVVFSFAPKRWHDDAEAREFVVKIGRAFRVPVPRIAFRIVWSALPWPFSIMNFHVLFYGLQE